MLLLSPTYCGPLENGEKALGPLRKFGKPQSDQVQPIAYDMLVRSTGDKFPAGRHYFIQTQYLPDLRAEAIEVSIEQAQRFSSPFSMLSFHHFHGAASRRAVSETAFALRQDHLLVDIMAAWEQQPGEEDRTHVEWTRKASHALAPYAFKGSYINSLDETEQERVPHAFGSNYERLADLKRTYDPDDVFDSTIGHVAPRGS